MKLLDCTLRDGGYINNWMFGKKAIQDIISGIAFSNIDYMELGFLRNVTYSPDCTLFNCISQVSSIIPPSTKEKISFSVMADFADLVPLENIAPYQPGFPEMIRVLIWKKKRDKYGKIHDALWEGYDYCKGLIEKGYQISIQPTRTNQYSGEEFLKMLLMFSQLDIAALYVADSWGNMTADEVLFYMNMADDVMKQGVLLGYHGHDNQRRTEEITCRIMQTRFTHEIIIDGSIDGIGKGGGNMKLQRLCKLVEDKYGKHYDIAGMERLSKKYIKDIYLKHAWGGEAFAIAGRYNCNPYYADYYLNELHLSFTDIESVISSLSEEDKIMYSKEKAYARMLQILYHKDINYSINTTTKVVITYGTFDLLHQGHINLLRRAKSLGDYLIVGVTSTEYDLQRGKRNVIQSLEERIENVRRTGYADKIIVERNKWQKVYDIMRYNVDIFTVGSDWEGKFDYLREYCQVLYLPRTEGISSSFIRKQMNEHSM